METSEKWRHIIGTKNTRHLRYVLSLIF